MKICVKVKPGSSREKIEKVDHNHLNVWLKVPAKEGKANERLLKLLSEFFGLPKSKIIIVSGLKSRNKVLILA